MAAGRIDVTASKALKTEVFTIMAPDETSDIGQNDPLIISLGNLWLLKT